MTTQPKRGRGRPEKPPVIYDKQHRELNENIARLTRRVQRSAAEEAELAADKAKLQGLVFARTAAMHRVLVACNGRAASHAITSWNEVFPLAYDAEAELIAKGVPVALRGGAEVVYTPAGPSANAYKHSAISTRVRLKRTGKGSWELVKAERCEIWPKQPARRTLHISPAARDAIIKRALQGIVVQEVEPDSGAADSAPDEVEQEDDHAPVT